jgi:hypothetical protein
LEKVEAIRQLPVAGIFMVTAAVVAAPAAGSILAARVMPVVVVLVGIPGMAVVARETGPVVEETARVAVAVVAVAGALAAAAEE